MLKKDTAPHEMTNAEFQEKLKQECKNNEELREETNEIKGIIRRAIAKGYPNFDNRDEFYDEIDNMLKGLKVKKPVFIRDVISKKDLQDVKEIRKSLIQINKLIYAMLIKVKMIYIFITLEENKNKFKSFVKPIEELERCSSSLRDNALKYLNYVDHIVESLERELKEDESK